MPWVLGRGRHGEPAGGRAPDQPASPPGKRSTRPLPSQPKSFSPALCHESDGADGSTSEGTQSTVSGKGTHNPVSGRLSQMWGACRAVSRVGLPRSPYQARSVPQCQNLPVVRGEPNPIGEVTVHRVVAFVSKFGMILFAKPPFLALGCGLSAGFMRAGRLALECASSS